MKTAIDTIRKALQNSSDTFQRFIDKVEDGRARSTETYREAINANADIGPALIALKSLEGQGPISVDERLPEDGKRILAFGRTKYAHKRGGFSGMLWETVTYFADEKAYVPSFQLNDELVDVTHWKELPSAPALTKSANP